MSKSIQITGKAKCSGCNACAASCPKQCIHMEADAEGFLYPVVDEAKCIDCGLCTQRCPVLHKPEPKHEDIRFYVTRANNKETLRKSTSGGFVTPVAEYVFSRNGVVCGAVFDDSFHVVHQIFEKEDQEIALEKMRGSKYVQSEIRGIYQQLKNYLEAERMVLFIGTPCQVYGLQSFLNREYEQLITIALVCHGVPSPMLWQKYIDYQENRFASRLKKVIFRHKTYGYHSGTMRLEFENGKVYHGSARVDYMLKSFFSEISSRPSCYQCAFKGISNISDFTIYDCWRPSLLIDGLTDDDGGYTNVITHTEKAEQVLSCVSDAFELYPIAQNRFVKCVDRIVLHSAIPHPQRKVYYRDIQSMSLPEKIAQHIPVNRKDRIVEAIKPLVYKTGMYPLAKKLLKEKL